MSYMKRAMEEIQDRGWPVNDKSLRRLEETILKQHGQKLHEWLDTKTKEDDNERNNMGKRRKDGTVR